MTNREYIASFCDLCGYPADAKEAFLEGYDKLCAHNETSQYFHSVLADYEADRFTDYGGMLETLNRSESGVHPYTLHFLAFLLFTRQLKERYAEAGIDEKIWFDSVCDLKWKLEECKKMFNIWGSFVAGWFPGFFTMERFALGRFQFEKVRFNRSYTWGDITINPDDTVLNFHIPSCGPLTDEKRLDSYARAAEFYRDLFPDDKPAVLTCSSWLLFPAHKEMLPPSSRIVAFINDFDLIRSWDDPDYHDFWRVFYREYKDNPDEMPAETALQRAYLERRRAGLPAGGGQGVILFKDGKIINK